jgi:UDP-N-acetylglucosamine acyltransferase
MSYSHIAHDCIVGNNSVIVRYVALGGFTEIGDFANIGGQTGIHQFSKIGAYTMIAAASIVFKDIPPYTLVGGRPLSYFNLNLVGLRRNGFTREQIDRISDIYRIIYKSGLNISDACKKIEEEFEESMEKRTILDFIKSSKRGVVKRVSNTRSDE